MDGIHDMGGMHGFGPVPFEKNEVPFHHEWERRVWGMRRAALKPAWLNLDCSRYSLERTPPAIYLSYSYFERWLYGLTTTMLEAGFVTLDEVKQGRAAPGAALRSDAPEPQAANPLNFEEYQREIDIPPRFKTGDRVHTANLHPPGHTRLPRYARDKTGQIHLHHGAHVLPDSNAHGQGEAPTHLYTVSFAAQTLWGLDASARDKVFLDIWECHLESA